MTEKRNHLSRKGKVLVGAYVAPELKAALRRKANAAKVTLSELIRKIFADAVSKTDEKN